MEEANHYDILAICYILTGSASCDTFDDFRAWLVMLGKEQFYSVLADPACVEGFLTRGSDSQAEELLYVANEAYLGARGKELPSTAYVAGGDIRGYKWKSSTHLASIPLCANGLDLSKGRRKGVGGETEAEVAALRQTVKRGVPFGSETWTTPALRKLGLESTQRPRGRPKKPQPKP